MGRPGNRAATSRTAASCTSLPRQWPLRRYARAGARSAQAAMEPQ